MREIDWREWISNKPDKTVFGVELELLLFNLQTKQLYQDLEAVDAILGNLPNQIFRDYYPWQLEIRTTPTSSVSKSINEMKTLYKSASKEFLGNDIMVIPMPSISSNAQVFCGLHIHFSFPDIKDTSKYWNKAMGVYPFALSIADHSKNSEISSFENSKRFLDSRHIGVPNFKPSKFLSLSGSPEERKYKDVILSPPIEHGNRHRLLKPITIEYRLFDTPSMFSMYKFIIEAMYNLNAHIKLDNPVVKGLTKDYEEMRRRLIITRNLIGGQRYGINKVFRMYNGNVCEAISEFFDIQYPEETQFEFRERKKLSQDINGYISMAIEGGWL